MAQADTGAGGAAALSERDVKPTIGIITALSHEYTAVKVLLESQRPIYIPGEGAGRQYLYGEIPAPDGGIHPIVLALLPDMGNNIASARAAILLQHFKSVRTVIMSGIAGGVPNPGKPLEHVRLGDIVTTSRQGVVQYDFDKEELEGGKPKITYRNPPRPPSASLIETARLLQAGEMEGQRPWQKYIQLVLEKLSINRPPEETDDLASSTDPDVIVPHPADRRRASGQPRVFSGPIASANKLLKNPVRRDQLRDEFGVKAVEMEGSGIADATWMAEAQYMVVRGVCDYCDKNKGDDWQEYAAVVAAAYIRALLEATPAGNHITSLPDPPQRAALNVLSSQLESVSTDLSDEKLNKLEELRELFREGSFKEAYEGVQQFRKSTNWAAFSGRLRAAVLRALAAMTLSLKKAGGVAEAAALADEARRAEPAEDDDSTLRARIKMFEAGHEAALEEVRSPKKLDGFNLRLGLLIETGRVDEALELLNHPPDSVVFDAETHRLHALALLASKDVHGARERISLALAERPRRLYVRFNAAVIDYLSALSAAALPPRLIPYPRPVPLSMVKADTESRERLHAAAEECKKIAELSVQGSDELKNVEAWRVACLAGLSDGRQEAADLCRRRLAEDPGDVRIIPWVLFHHFDVDLSPSISALEQSLETPANEGHPELENLTTLLDIHRNQGTYQEGLNLLDKTKGSFGSADETDLLLYWQAQLLTASGQAEAALEISSQVADPSLRRAIRTSSLSEIGNATGDWQQLISFLEHDYEQEKNISSLLTLCDVKGQLGDWPYVADRAELYGDAVRTSSAARFVIGASWNAKRPAQCLQLLDRYQPLFADGQPPPDLRKLRVHCLINTGDIKGAVAEAEKLAEDHPGVESILLLMDVQLIKGDLTGLEVSARRLLTQGDVAPGQLLRAAHLVQLNNPSLAKKLWTKASESALDDPDLTAFAVHMAAKLGVENQRGSLMQRMMEYAAQGQGPVQVMTMEQTLEMMREGRERQERLEHMYASGEAPLHLLAKNGLASIFRGLAEWNRTRSDAHIRKRILVRHGGRTLLSVDYAASVKNWRLHCDTTSLLLAHELGILDKVEKIFKPLRIPRHVITALIAQRDNLRPHQQSQLDDSRVVLDLLSKGRLRVLEERPSEERLDEVRRLVADVASEAASTDEHVGGGTKGEASEVIPANAANLEQQLGRNRLEMLAAALSEETFAVGFLPVTSYGVGRHALLSLPQSLNNRIVNSRAVIDSLRGSSRITQEAHSEAIRTLGVEGQEHSAANPLVGSKLFLMQGVADVLAKANLLERVCSAFDVFISPDCVKEAEGTVEFYERQAKIERWLSELIDRIRDGLDDSTYEIISIPDDRVAQRDEREEKLDHEFTASLDLFLFELREWDVIWVDDRALNKYPFRSDEKVGVPLMGINEILLALHSLGELDEHDYYNLLQHLRESDFRYIPLDEKEILHHLRNARIEGARVVETDALLSLRRYYSSSLLDKDILQVVSTGGAPNPHSELPFVVQVVNVTFNAIAGVWADDKADVETATARANWILNNFYTGNYGCSHLRGDGVPRSAAFGPAKLIALDLINLLMRGVGMHGSPLISEPVQRRNHYFNWLTERIIASSLGSDPQVIKATAEELQDRFAGVKELDTGSPENELFTRAFMGKFFLDLPDIISNEMEFDREMKEWLRLITGSVVTAAGVGFPVEEYWRAVERAVADGSATIKAHTSDAEFRLLRYEGGEDELFPVLSLIDSENNKVGEMGDPSFGLLLPSVESRRAALGKLRMWFDCGQKEFGEEADALASVEDAVTRMKRLYEWRTRSSELYYSQLEQRFRANEPVALGDLLPPSAVSIAGRLRLPLTTESRDFSAVWRASATSLLAEEDLLTAVARLASVPAAMPQEAVVAVSRMPEGERLELFERLATAWTSPLRRLHLVNLALRSSPSSDTVLEIARKVLARLYDMEAGAKDFRAFHSVLLFVGAELETRAEGRRWSADVKLAVTWAHASRIHGMLHGLGISAERILSLLEGAGLSSFRESLVRDPETWSDSAHPRRLNRTRFLTHGVASMLAGVEPQVLEAAGVLELIRGEAFRVAREASSFPEYSLLSDPALHQDALASLLGGDRHALLSSILGPEGSEILKSDSLKQVAKNYLEDLVADPSKAINWTGIRIVTDDLPVYPDLTELCRRTLETFDPFAARKDGFRPAWLVFQAAAYQAMHLRDENLRQRFREHLVEMLRYEVANGTDDAPDTEFNSLRNRVGGLIEIASILSNVPGDPAGSTREFTSMLEMMSEQWADFSKNFRHILSREVWNLPIEEGESWWRFILRMRAAK